MTAGPRETVPEDTTAPPDRRTSAVSPAGPWVRRGALLALAVVLVLVPRLGLGTVWMGIVVQIGIYACPAIGAMVLLGWTGQISLAQATFMGVAAYATALVSVHYLHSPWWGLPTGMLVSAAFATIIGFPVLRLQGLYLVMATAALNIGAVVLVLQNESYLGGAQGLAGVAPLNLFGTDLFEPEQQYYVVLVAVVLIGVLTRSLVRSPVGAMFAAMRHDQTAAGLTGIPVWTLKVKTFILSAVWAAVGGFLLVEYLTLATTDSYSTLPSLNLLVMVVIGGMRSVPGAVLGAAFVIVVPQLIPSQPAAQELIFAGAFLLVTMLVPTGLAGALGAAGRFLASRRPSVSPAGPEGA
jgi:branched-chain amino acid transport system permease protein